MRRIITLALIVGTGVVAVARTSPPAPPPAMATAARAFLDSLTADQKKIAQYPFNAEERFVWFYWPIERKGLTLKAMTEPQRKLAMNLLRTGLSEKGYAKAETIRSLEDVLAQLEKGPRPVGALPRDPELYYFSIFGDPGPKATWGWRYEGHHLSHNWTVVNGTAMATTPQFFGANPAEVKEGPRAGVGPLAAEDDLGLALVRSLDESQRQTAIIDPKSPIDILTSNTREAAIREQRGLPSSKMTDAQRTALLRLIEEHAGAQTDPIARDRLARAKNTLNTALFAWMGGTEKGQGHYYRIQGSTFMIELVNTQNNANHIHQVWRDFKGDWGRDLLAEHLKSAPH